MDQVSTAAIVNNIIADKGAEPSTNVENTEVKLSSELTPDADSPDLSEKKPETDERMASRFAALSKKEKQLVEKERQLKAELEELRGYKKDKDYAKTNPMEFMEKHGLKLDDILGAALGKKIEPNVEDQIKELQERIARKEKEDLERIEKQKIEEQDNNIKVFKDNIRKHIDNDPDTFELIKQEEAYETVFAVINEYFTKTADPETGIGIVMDIAEAAKKVEEYLENHYEKIAKNSKKLQSKFGLTKENPSDTKLSTSPTLTNKQVLGSNKERQPLLSEEESKRKAAALLRWT